MRPIVFVAVALAGMSLTSTFADAGTWCGTNTPMRQTFAGCCARAASDHACSLAAVRRQISVLGQIGERHRSAP